MDLLSQGILAEAYVEVPTCNSVGGLSVKMDGSVGIRVNHSQEVHGWESAHVVILLTGIPLEEENLELILAPK